MMATANAILAELSLIADRMHSGGGPGDIKKLDSLAKRHKARISSHRKALKKESHNIVDGRTVESAHADIVQTALNLCDDLIAWTGTSADAKLVSARIRDYVAKVRPELEHEAQLVEPTKQGGRPPSKAKAEAVREYKKARATGKDRKEATRLANQKAGTTYKRDTLIRYSKKK